MKQTVTRVRQAMLGVLLVFIFSSRATAQTPMHITPTGTSNNVFPLGSTTNMVQWVFIPTDFTTTIPGNSFITTIYLRPNSGSSVTTTTYTDLQIKMGATTATAMAGGTWIGGLTTVLNSSSYTMSPPATSGGWIPFTLTTPFYYGGGNFYLEISQQGYTGSGLTIAQDGTATARRQWGTVSSSTASNFGAGLVTLGVDVIPADCSGQPTNPTIATPAINPATPVCIGATTTITGVNPNLGTGLSVFWQTASSPTGPWSNVTTGSGANTLTYTTGPISANTYFRMGVNCSFSNLNAYSAAYFVPVGAPQPGTIQGPSTFCPGDTAIYSVPAVTGTTYAWTLPAGWIGSSTTNSIQVRPNGSPGTVSVIATSPCGTSIAQSRAIVNGYAPAAATAINGSAYICAGSSQTYSVAPASGATTYIWSLPAGWKGSLTPTSDTTRVPTITIPAVNNSGTISVRTRNGCGHSQPTSLAVNVISSLASPGAISGRDTICSGRLETYSIAPVNGATSYVWSLPSGWSGTTSGTSVQVFGGTATGTLTVTAYVSCATSPASSRTLTALTTITPTVSLSTPPGVVCEGTQITFTANSTGGGSNPMYTWRRNNAPVTGTGNTFTSAMLQNGDVISVSMLSNASCVTNNTVSSAPLSLTVAPAVTPGISINTLPVTSICRGTSFTLNATATGGGPGPRYEWFLNGNSMGANGGLSYTSSTFNDKDTVTIRLHSNAICATEDSVESNRVGIEVYDALTPTVSVSVSPSEIIEPGVPVTFTATQSNGGATPDYQWLRNGVNIPFETGATYTSSGLQPNDHITVRMLSYLSCASPKVALSNAIVMRAGPLSVGTRASAAGLNLYPNPSAGRLNLRGAEALSGGLRLEVLSLVGQLAHRIELPGGGAAANWEESIELPQSLAEGRYLLRVSTMSEGVRQTLGTLPFALRKQ